MITNNINIEIVQFEQQLKAFINSSELPITIINSIIKNVATEMQQETDRFLVQLDRQMKQQAQLEQEQNEVKEEEK